MRKIVGGTLLIIVSCIPLFIGLWLVENGWNRLPEVGSVVKNTVTYYPGTSREKKREWVDSYYSFSDKVWDFKGYVVFGGFFLLGGVGGILYVITQVITQKDY